MQFQIPQFIDKETLLLGPLTITQSIYIGSSILGAIIMHLIFDGMLAWFFAFLLIISALGLSFFKIEGRPLLQMILALLSFFHSPKLYLWEMKFSAPKLLKMKKEKIVEKRKYSLSQDGKPSRLHDLSFKLNIKGKDE